MAMSIGSTSSYASALNQTTRPPRLDPSKMAENLFSKLDTQNKGYLDTADFANALQGLSSKTSTSSTTTASTSTSGTGLTASSTNTSSSVSADQVLSALDTNGDGKVTKDEMSSNLKKMAAELDSQFNAMRMAQAGGQAGGMPPPPPRDSDRDGDNDAGMSKDQLTQVASTTTDSKLAALTSKMASNFDAADTNGDGKVSRTEAMTYDQKTQSTSSTASTSKTTSTAATSTDSTTATDSSKSETLVFKRILDLMKQYRDQATAGVSIAVAADTQNTRTRLSALA
mgnify:CR=1 FL=1